MHLSALSCGFSSGILTTSEHLLLSAGSWTLLLLGLHKRKQKDIDSPPCLYLWAGPKSMGRGHPEANWGEAGFPASRGRLPVCGGVFTKHWATFPDEILCWRIILMKMSFPLPPHFILSVHLSAQGGQTSSGPRSLLIAGHCSLLTSPRLSGGYDWQTPRWHLYLGHKRYKTQVPHCQLSKGQLLKVNHNHAANFLLQALVWGVFCHQSLHVLTCFLLPPEILSSGSGNFKILLPFGARGSGVASSAILRLFFSLLFSHRGCAAGAQEAVNDVPLSVQPWRWWWQLIYTITLREIKLRKILLLPLDCSAVSE